MRRRPAAAPLTAPQGRAGARRLRRALLVALLVTLAVPATWLLTINLSLWTGLVGHWVSGERPRSTIRLHYGWAWCVWPTVVHVRDLRLEIDGARWQLAVDVPEGTVDIDLLELTHRHLDARAIHGRDVRVAFAVKRPFGADPQDYAEYPRIDGFPAPALDEAPRPVPTEDRAWRIDLRDVDADVTHLHVNQLAADLRGHLAGALEVTVGHRFALPQVQLDVEEGALRRGDVALVDALTAHLDVALAAYDPEAIQGREALRQLSGALELGAHSPDLDVLAALGARLPLALGGADAHLTAALGLDAGALTPGSEVHLTTPRIHLRRSLGDGAVALTGAARVDATIPEGGGGPRIAAVLHKLRARDAGGESAWLRADELTATAAFASLDLVDGPGSLTAWRAELPDFTADLGASSRLGDVGVRGGKLAGHASVARGDTPEIIDLDFAVDASGLSLRHGDLSLRGAGYVRSTGEVRRDDHTLALGPVHAALRGLRIDTARGHTTGTDVEVKRATLDYHWDKQRLRVDVRGRLDEVRTLLAHVRPGEDLFERAPRLARAEHPADFSLSLHRTPRATRLDLHSLKGGPLDIVAAIARAGDSLRGAVYLRRARIGVLTEGGDDRKVKLAVGPEWFEEMTGWVRGVVADRS